MVITPSQRGTHTGTFPSGNATPSTSKLSVFSWWHYDSAGQVTRHYSTVNVLFDQIELWLRAGEEGIVLTYTKAAAYGLRTHKRTVQGQLLMRLGITHLDHFLTTFLSLSNPLIEVASTVQAHEFLKMAHQKTGIGGVMSVPSLAVLHTEIDQVIKPAGLTRSQYQTKRRKKLGVEQTLYRWRVYEKYQQLLRSAGCHDRSDLLALTSQKLEQEPPQQNRFAHLIVCEPHLWNTYEIGIIERFLR